MGKKVETTIRVWGVGSSLNSCNSGINGIYKDAI